MQVIFTRLSERQVADLYEYIARQTSEARADTYVARIIAACEGLATFPKRGSRRDDLLPGLRTIGFERRVTIAFVVTSEAVLTEGILYGGQNFEAAFREE